MNIFKDIRDSVLLHRFMRKRHKMPSPNFIQDFFKNIESKPELIEKSEFLTDLADSIKGYEVVENIANSPQWAESELYLFYNHLSNKFHKKQKEETGHISLEQCCEDLSIDIDDIDEYTNRLVDHMVKEFKDRPELEKQIAELKASRDSLNKILRKSK